MKTLLIDIETSPNVGDVWRLWKQNISIDQLRESSRVICFGAKWLDKRGTMFYSDWKHGHGHMVDRAYELLEEADQLVHWNGRRFDVPHLFREFLLAGYPPPAPSHQLDLLETVKRRFAFPSNKLDYVSQTLCGTRKVKHEGHELWVKVLAGDPAAQRKMERYNRKDVLLMEPIYHKLEPWLLGPMNMRLHKAEGDSGCPHCGGQLVRNGYQYTTVGKYQRYRCAACGAPSRASKNTAKTNIRPVAY